MNAKKDNPFHYAKFSTYTNPGFVFTEQSSQPTD